MLPTTHATLNWAQLSGKQSGGASSRGKSIPIEGTLSDKGSGEGWEHVGWGKCPREEPGDLVWNLGRLSFFPGFSFTDTCGSISL